MFMVWLMWVLIALFWAALLGGGGYVILRFLRAYERRSNEGADMAELEERIRLLEESNVRLQTEISAIDEAHQFTVQLLTERTPAN